eukprot:TRINITY_DN4208_c0_g1_i5.p1 TRINITY_DN4208_c0_g1~~TRINITY_DN4208_c0_g1_i5.p1  ORF type:complete len:206 (-),score=13.85 TRINITY_DN4208_c0_g1_i5:291-908(-)
MDLLRFFLRSHCSDCCRCPAQVYKFIKSWEVPMPGCVGWWFQLWLPHCCMNSTCCRPLFRGFIGYGLQCGRPQQRTLSSEFALSMRVVPSPCGIWRAQILDILDYRSSGAGRVRIVLGGDVGQLGIATFELKVDTEKIPLSLARGEPVELVLLSDRLDFSDFHLVKEAWLPWRRVWVAEETHIDRQNFEDLSRQLEEENFWRREE